MPTLLSERLLAEEREYTLAVVVNRELLVVPGTSVLVSCRRPDLTPELESSDTGVTAKFVRTLCPSYEDKFLFFQR